MRIFTDGTVVVGWIVSKIRPPQWSATFIVKGTYRLRPGLPAAPFDEPDPLSGDTYVDDDPARSLRYPSDFSVHKPRTDVMVVGDAHAPAGAAVPELGVRFALGTFSKTLRVVGDRVWSRAVDGGIRVSNPEPFTTMPLGYERAFGGPGFGPNPVGRGRRSTLAPNVEDLRLPFLEPERAAPAGFAPLACTWDQRRALLGTYGDQWLRERWPWFPEDFDAGYFNAAPRDQQLESTLGGDEEVLLQNLHADVSVFRSALPGRRARCFTNDRAADGELAFREVPLRLDTVWLDAASRLLIREPKPRSVS